MQLSVLLKLLAEKEVTSDIEKLHSSHSKNTIGGKDTTMAFSSRSFDYSSDRLIPCVVLDGPPTEKTDGAIGVLCIDRESGNLYVCVSADYCDRMFTWKIVGDVSEDMIRQSVSDFLSQNPVSGSLSDTEKDMLLTLLRGAVYQSESAEETTAAYSYLQNLWRTESKPDSTDLTSISAVYSGGDVAVGTAVTDLTGIVVTAHYSDGSTETVTGYTMSGEIAEGENTVTVSYSGKTATFTVTGVAESGGTTIVLSEKTFISSQGKPYIGADDTSEMLFGMESGYGWTSENAFDNDTNVHIVVTVNSRTYVQFAIGSALASVAPYSLTTYHSIQAVEPSWMESESFEIDYTVRAGHRLGIMNGRACDFAIVVTEV